jgi:hypothetical protein
MTMIQGRPGRGRYLISGSDANKLGDFMTAQSSDADMRLLDTIGPPDAPHTAVFDMSHDKAAELQRHFAAGGGLNIEPDQPLSMFGTSSPGN